MFIWGFERRTHGGVEGRCAHPFPLLPFSLKPEQREGGFQYPVLEGMYHPLLHSWRKGGCMLTFLSTGKHPEASSNCLAAYSCDCKPTLTTTPLPPSFLTW